MASFQHYHTLEKYFGSGQGSKQFFKVKSGLEAIPFCLVRARSDSFSTFPSEKMQGFAQAAREVVAEADKGRLELEKALGSKTGFKYVTELANGKFQARCKHPDTKQVRALAGVFDTAEEAAVMVALNKKSPAGGGAVAARAKRGQVHSLAPNARPPALR